MDRPQLQDIDGESAHEGAYGKDVDSLVMDEVRRFFVNEVDGVENNEGIVMIGSTKNCTAPTAKVGMSRGDGKR